MTPRRFKPVLSAIVDASRFAGGAMPSRERSGLTICQVFPRSRDRKIRWWPKYSVRLSAGEKTSGSVHVERQIVPGYASVGSTFCSQPVARFCVPSPCRRRRSRAWMRVGREVAALAADVDRTEILLRDRLILGRRRRRGRSGILLRAVDAVRKRIVGCDVIELPGRLVVPRTPRLRAVHATRRRLDRCRESCGPDRPDRSRACGSRRRPARRESRRTSCRRRWSGRSRCPSRRRRRDFCGSTVMPLKYQPRVPNSRLACRRASRSRRASSRAIEAAVIADRCPPSRRRACGAAGEIANPMRPTFRGKPVRQAASRSRRRRSSGRVRCPGRCAADRRSTAGRRVCQSAA